MAGSRGQRLRERLRERNPFPEGSATIGLWLIVGGVTAYLFLAVSGQVLGSERYSALAVLWVIAFTAAPGFSADTSPAGVVAFGVTNSGDTLTIDTQIGQALPTGVTKVGPGTVVFTNTASPTTANTPTATGAGNRGRSNSSSAAIANR